MKRILSFLLIFVLFFTLVACNGGNDNNSNKENKTLIFRTRREGDMFSFQKRNITKSLGKALREIGVPSKLRDSVICLCEGSVVLWCEALGYSTQGKIYTQNQNLTIELNGEKCYDVTQGR